MDKTLFINVPVDKQMKAMVKKLTDEKDLSEAAVVRQALREYLQDEDTPTQQKKPQAA